MWHEILAINEKSFRYLNLGLCPCSCIVVYCRLTGVKPDLEISLAMSHPTRGKVLVLPLLFGMISMFSHAVSDLNLSPKPRSLLELFHEKRDTLLGGRIRPKFPLRVEAKLYDNFILQLKHEMAGSKEKEKILSEKWHHQPRSC